MSPVRLSLPALYLAIFLLALTGLFAKLIPLDAVSMIQLRGVVAALALLAISLIRRRSLKLPDWRQGCGVYGLGLLLGIHWVTFFHAMQVSTVAIGMLSLFSYPMLTILFEPLFSGQPLRRADVTAGAIMFLGLAIMLSQGQLTLDPSIVSGVLWGLFSAALFALRNLLQKYRFVIITSDCLMFHQVVAVALLLLFFVDFNAVEQLSSEALVKVILLGVFSTAGAHTLFSYCLKLRPAKSVALISCLQPVIATLLAWMVVAEVPGIAVIVGGGLVLSVAAYESWPKGRKGS